MLHLAEQRQSFQMRNFIRATLPPSLSLSLTLFRSHAGPFINIEQSTRNVVYVSAHEDTFTFAVGAKEMENCENAKREKA